SSSKRTAAEKARYYDVSPGKRIGMGVAFLVLLAVTSFGMLVMQIPLDEFSRQGAGEQQATDDYKSHVRVR
ncbi:MAG: hypothetical protein GQ530_04795, partial [Desulfuromonadales bacterium]|nr:hypothetical protein [Desulfuromonadales bacterium]